MNHEGTKGTKEHCLKDHANQSVHKAFLIEIDEQADVFVHQFHMGEQLGFVNGRIFSTNFSSTISSSSTGRSIR